MQSMKRTEELIHLSKKIHFEGKVHACSWRDGVRKGAALVSSGQFLTRLPHPFPFCAFCPAVRGLTRPPPCLLHPSRSSH